MKERILTLMLIEYWLMASQCCIRLDPLAKQDMEACLERAKNSTRPSLQKVVERMSTSVMNAMITYEVRMSFDCVTFEESLGDSMTALNAARLAMCLKLEEDDIRAIGLGIISEVRPLLAKMRASGCESDIREFSPKRVAQAITLLVFDTAFKRIQPRMLVSEDARANAFPVQMLHRYFKVLSNFHLTILTAPGLSPGDRVELLVYFLDVAEHLRKMCSYHACFAVVSGLFQSMHYVDVGAGEP